MVPDDPAELLCGDPITEHTLAEPDAVELAGVFAALADPVRLRLLSIIASNDETCSCNLEAPLAGLIVGERRGRWTWWRVVPEQLAALQSSLRVVQDHQA